MIRNKRKIFISLLIVLIVGIGLGYAFLTSDLKINGKNGISRGNWIIYFDNVQNESGVVSSKTEINEDKDIVSFDIKITKPGDYYEFDVDTVNDGTIDAMVESVEFEGLDNKFNDLVYFDVNYKDSGMPLEKCDLLEKKTRKTITVKVKYEEDITEEDLLEENDRINLKFKINYVQNGECSRKPLIIIDPNGGSYNGSKKIVQIPVDENTEYELQEPTHTKRIFEGFILSDGNILEKDENNKLKVQVEDKDVKLVAKWSENDYVARIVETNQYYESVQEAFDAALTNNTVELLRNVSESPINSKTIVFDLGGYTLTGLVTNSKEGNIRLTNGKISSGEIYDTAFINYGILTMGEKGEPFEIENSITLYGKEIGLKNVKTDDSIGEFYFYDGYIEGKSGLVGGYTDKEDNYYVFSDHVTERNTQRFYLIKNPNRAVAKTETDGTLYYYNLQDTINAVQQNKRMFTLSDEDYIIYALREFEAAYELKVASDSRIVFDINGNDVSTGAKITNNGYFKITNTSDMTARVKPSVAIENNNELVLDSMQVVSTTDSNTIENKAKLVLRNSSVQSKAGYAVNNSENGVIDSDSSSILTSTSSYGLHNTGNNFEINNGNVYGFFNEGKAFLKERVKIYNGSNVYGIKNTGTINMNGGEVIGDSNDSLIYNTGTFNLNSGSINGTSTGQLIYNLGTFNVNGGVITSPSVAIKDGKINTSTASETVIYTPKVNINGGEVTATLNAIESLNVNIKNGTVTSLEKTAVSSENSTAIYYVYSNGYRYVKYIGKVNMSGGTVSGKTYGIYTNELNMSGGTVTSEEVGTEEFSYKYNNNSSIMINSKTEISGGIINSTSTGVITEHLNMSDGNINSSTSAGILSKEEGTITGGTVSGKTYGVYNNGVLNIGSNDQNILVTSPVLIGELYGVYIEGTETNFYDGSLKGKTDGYYGKITATPNGAVIFEKEETIDDEGYQVDYIAYYKNWLRVGDKEFYSIDLASKEIDSEGTITVIDDAEITFFEHFLDEEKNKNITFDLNGHTIKTTQSIINESNVKIVDSVGTGKIISTRISGLVNSSKMTILGGNFASESSMPAIENKGELIVENANVSGAQTAVYNYNKLTINNINITDSNIGILNSYESSKLIGLLTINDGLINANDKAISLAKSGNKVVINGGTINGTNSAITGDYGTIEINDGTITSTDNYAVHSYYNTITVNGGSITSANSYGVDSHYNFVMNNGYVEGTIGLNAQRYSDNYSLYTINNGHIVGKEAEGINSVGNNTNYGYIYGGVIEGKTDGVHTTSRIQIGRDDGNIIVDKPELIGHTTYGLVTETYAAFYDGTLKGKVDGYSGLISIIPDASLIKDDYEYINKLEYQTDYLVNKGNFLKVGNNEYNSINKAYNAINGEEGTIEVISDAYIDFAQSIPNGKKVTLNLNGHNLIMTQPLDVKGNAVIVDTVGNGGINNLRDNVILNSGTLVIEAGSYNSEKVETIKNTGNLTINNANITSPISYALNNSGTAVINGGSLQADKAIGIYTTNKLTINGGTILAKESYGIHEYSGTTTINGGNITSEKTYGIIVSTYYYSTSTLNMTGGVVTGKTYGIYNNYENYNTINISGGKIIGEENSGLYTTCKTNLSGGEFIGEKYGVYTTGSSTTTKIGENDGTINIDAPIIKGELYGLYINAGTVNFYDGILKGITGRYYGTITNIADHAQIFEDEEVEDRKNYLTAYLVTETEVALNVQTEEVYGNLQTAISEAKENETIKLLTNLPLYYEISANNKSNVTLDLNGKTISTNKKITISVPFNIINSSEDEATIKTSSNIHLITNSSNLSITNVTLKNSSNNSNYYTAYNTGNLILNNVKVDSGYGISNTNNLTINNSNIKASYTAINNSGTLNITNGSYNGNSYSLYSNSTKTINVDGATFTGTYYNSGTSTSVLENVVIKGYVQNNSGAININDSSIKSGKISNSGVLELNNVNYDTTIGNGSSTSPDIAVTNSNTLTLTNSRLIINTEKTNGNSLAISNTGTLNIKEESSINIGLSTNTSYENRGILNSGSGTVNIDNSNLYVLGGTTSYGIYINGDNAKVTILSGRIDVQKSSTAYGVYANKGTFEMGHYEGTGHETAVVSTTDPVVYVQGNSRGIGVKKTNGSFNFYDGIIRASKFAKPETTTNVEYQYEVTTYVDENTGFEYAMLEWMRDDYQGDTVALLNGVYYKTVQEAIDKAESGDQIRLLKSVSEDLTVPLNKNVGINLNKHSITTSIINSGTLNVYNGSLQSFDKTTIINYGTFIMGEDDGKVSSANIRVISETTTIKNTGTLIVYDGYVEGETAIEGEVTRVANFARIRTEQDVQSEKKYIQSLSEEAIKAKETDLILTIDPASGYYEGSKDVQEIYLLYQDTYILKTPTKNGCTFLGWDISVPEAYNNGVITIDLQDVTVRAKWEVSENAVASIGEDYFTSLQQALDAAEDGDTVYLFKDVTENVTNRKKVTIDLGGKKVTGAFVNQGELKLINGTIENTNGIGLENKKSLTLGENDGEIDEENVIIIGTTIGLQQDGRFNFYDGYIEGDVALNGKVDAVPKGYFLYNDHNSVKDCQKVYLIGNPENAVAVTQDGGTQYFFNLQDAIDTATLTGNEIYITRSFEAPYALNVKEGADITINMSGYSVSTGNTITNKGKLKIYDSSEETTSLMTNARTITNSGELIIDKVDITENNSSNVAITNTGKLNISNTTIKSTNGYTINTSGAGDLQVGENTTLTATGNYAIYNNQTKPLEINTGTISGINNLKELTIGGDIEVKVTGRYAINLTTANAKFTMNNGLLQSNTHVIYMYGSNIQVTINDGYIKETGSTYTIYDGYNTSSESYRSYVTINGGVIDGNYYGIYVYMNTFTMNGGEIRNTYPSSGSQNSYYALYCGSYSICSINEGSKITSYNTSAIYKESSSKNLTIDGAEITTNASNGYGVFIRGGNTTINNTKIDTPGTSSYGIYVDTSCTNRTVTLNNNRIISGNIGVYLNSCNDSRYTTKLNVNSGYIYGDTYGIRQESVYSTLNIGNPESDSTTDPYIKGKLYGVYKISGTTNFYSGRLSGLTNGYNNDSSSNKNEIDNVTNKKEITSTTEADSVASKANTHSITDFSSVATPQTAKAGNGFARITYIDEEGICGITETDFNYTEREQSFLVPCSGKYKLEVWGAQGGSVNDSYPGGYGGYSKGEITLTENEVLYINVGGAGTSIKEQNKEAKGGYNGGGNAITRSNSYTVSSGGGATHIAKTSGLLSTLENNKDSILIVAGGGGGTQYYNGYYTKGGSGGGYQGARGTYSNASSSVSYNTIGGSQERPGYYLYDNRYGMGSFGQGASIDESTIPSSTGYYGSGGGGGYYGGGAPYSTSYSGGAGGSGYTENSLLSNTEMYGYNIPVPQVDFVENYLISKDNFLQVGENQYNSFDDAISYIDENLEGKGTIILLKDAIVRTSAIIPSTDEIVFDLAGNNLTMTTSITNTGTFSVIDSSEDKNATITNKNTNVFINQGTLNVINGSITSEKSNAILGNTSGGIINVSEGVNLSGTNAINLTAKQNVNVEKATLTGSTYSVTTSATGSELVIKDSTLTGSTHGIYLNSYNMKITLNNTNVYGNNGSGIYDNYTSNSTKNTINITGGSVNGTTYGMYLNYSNLNTENVTIKTTSSSTSYYALNMNAYGPIATMNDGTEILSPNTSAVRLNTSLTMNGGTINAGGTDSNGVSFYDSPGGAISLNIYGGTIYGKKNGIYQKHSNITTTIGNKEEELSIETPLVEGGEYGIYREAGKSNFYSGRLKGIKKSYYGEFSKVTTNKSIYTMEEVIDEENPKETYKISYLTDTDAFLEVDGTTYNNFKDAIASIDGTGTIKVLNDALVHEEITIPEGKNITIDLNSKKITMSQTIINNSNLTITDLSDDKQGTINNIVENGIQNNGNLTISYIKLASIKTAIYGNSGAGNITLDNNAKLSGDVGIYLNTAQKINATDSTITGSTIGIRMQADSSSLTMNNSSVSGGTYGIYTYGYKNTLTITDSKVSSTGSGIYDERSKNDSNISSITINGGTISGSTYGIYSLYDKLEVTGTTINNNSSTKTNYGIYCNTGSTCNLNSGTIINAANSSGIYSYSTTNLKGVEINSSGNDSYGIYVNGGTITLSDETEINSNGVLSYGIYADQYQTTINVNSADIYSKNIGIYLGNARTDAKTLNVNSGSVVGETYGIYQTVANGTTIIGSLENENSIEDPYIEGGLISINKSAGLLYFYSGKLKGYLKGNPGTIDYVRDGYEIFEDSDEIQLYLKNNRTISTSEAQETATENTAKIGNGYSKITYIEKESDSLNSPTIVDEISNSISSISSSNDAIEIYDFEYTGYVQRFESPSSGIYKLEVWGAQGGTDPVQSTEGGHGGYSQGTLYLDQGTELFIYVGGQGGNKNMSSSSWRSTGGGGGTDISLYGEENSTDWNNNSHFYSRILVAGGGGGMHGSSGGSRSQYDDAGTDSRAAGTFNAINGSYSGGSWKSATINSPGTCTYSGSTKKGFFGYAYTVSHSNNNSFGGWNGGSSGMDSWATGGAGGGWYGGAADWPNGGGGSGYAYSSEYLNYYPTGCLLNEDYLLENVELKNGIESFLSPSGSLNKGNTGNGYARISYLGGEDSDSDSYTVKLKSDYGTIENSELTYLPGDTLGNIPQPVLENNNMEFVGWFTNRSFTKMVTSNTIVNASFTLYAKFIYTDAYCTSTVNSTQSFDYTGSEQTFTALCPGKYKLEVWGAQGGNSSYNANSDIGGYGGYSSGEISLKREEKLYIYVGGQGQSIDYLQSSNKRTYSETKGYNGGGWATTYTNNSAHAGGGGATHVATSSGLLRDLSNNKKSVLIVAGGGGGASTHSSYPSYSGTGGSGGGLTGGIGITDNNKCYNYGTGGTQTAVGTYKACEVDGRTSRDSNPPGSPGFGYGSNYTNNSTSYVYSGGGAGWYGGQSGYHAPGGGGSGYVGNSRISNSIMYGYNIDTYYDKDITNIAYLVENKYFIKNLTTNKEYLNLQTAIDEVDNEDTLQLFADSNLSYEVTINDGDKFTIDFNGYSLATSKQIINNGNITIKNTNLESDSSLTNNISMTLFVNNGVLTINNVDINAYNAISNTTTGKLDVKDSYIKATNQAIINEGALTVDTSTISGTVYGIYSNSSRADNVTNSTINSNSTAFYKYNLGKSTITTTTINGGVNNNKTGSVLEITGGSISGLVNNIGNTTIKQANIEYTSKYTSTEYFIKNSGLLSLEDDTIRYINTTNNTNNYSLYGLYNTGTTTSSGNSYTTIYNYNNMNNYNSYRYKTIYNVYNSAIFNSTDDSFETYGGSSGYGIYNTSNNTNVVNNPTMKIHNNSSSFGLRNASGKINIVNGTIEIYTSSTGYGTYTDAGTPTITGTSIYVHDNSSTSYGSYINGGTLTIESGNTLITGGTVYGTYTANGSSTLVLGVEDGRGTDAADVSTETPYIKAVGTSTGVGIRTGDGFLAFYDGYFTGSTSPRLSTDTTSLIEKNYQVVTKQDEETGYNYCILEFIK